MELALSSPQQFVNCLIKMKGNGGANILSSSDQSKSSESWHNLHIPTCKAKNLHIIPATQGKVYGKHAVQLTEFVIVFRSMDMVLSHNSMWLWEKDDEICGENDEEAGLNILATSEQIKSF